MTAATRLQQLRQACRDTLDGWDDTACRAQHHAELSPLSWHLGHVFFVETYWLQEVVLGSDEATAAWHTLYFPEHCPKGERVARLPARDELLDWTRELAAANDDHWPRAERSGHRLMADDYLRRFLIQHYAQHLETMQLVRRQARLRDSAEGAVRLCTPASPLATAAVDLAAGERTLGGDSAQAAYDNELPAHRGRIEACRLAAHPVTNAQWLAFMTIGGYHRRELWTGEGQAWLAASGARAPEHWRPHPDGGWYSADPGEPLKPDAPVHGICAHEADAFVRWVAARLPHEHEWEAAAGEGLLGDDGVWEWCGNTLYPYPGFTAFPYEGYSLPWLDGRHRVLRGASRFTAAEIRRPSFRNFYPEGHRHVLAGLRLAWDLST